MKSTSQQWEEPLVGLFQVWTVGLVGKFMLMLTMLATAGTYLEAHGKVQGQESVFSHIEVALSCPWKVVRDVLLCRDLLTNSARILSRLEIVHPLTAGTSQIYGASMQLGKGGAWGSCLSHFFYETTILNSPARSNLAGDEIFHTVDL